MAAIGVVLISMAAAAQQQPQVRVNFLNVCAPSDAEQKDIASALARIPRRPVFAADFEIARGRSTAVDLPASRWVRIRYEFPASSPYLNVQYSFSIDEKAAVETLVFRLREPKDLMQVSIENSALGATPESLLGANASAGRVKLEYFGKASVALARCENADQSAYQPLFRTASEIMNIYRTSLHVRRTVPADLARTERPAPSRSEVSKTH